MQKIFGLLVLIFAAAILVTAMAQPASAYFDPQEKEESRQAEKKKTELKNLVEENERLREELGDVREETRRAQKELDELKLKLLKLKNAAILRHKLQSARAHVAEEKSVVADKISVSPPDREGAPVSTCSVENANASDSGEETVKVVSENKSPEKPETLSHFAETVMHNEYLERIKALVDKVLLRNCPSVPTTFTRTCSEPEPQVEPVRPEPPESKQDLEPLRSRMKALKSRLKKALEDKEPRLDVETGAKAPEPKEEKPVPRELREKILRRLRTDFNRELNRKLRELKREMRNTPSDDSRQSRWF